MMVVGGGSGWSFTRPPAASRALFNGREASLHSSPELIDVSAKRQPPAKVGLAPSGLRALGSMVARNLAHNQSMVTREVLAQKRRDEFYAAVAAAASSPSASSVSSEDSISSLRPGKKSVPAAPRLLRQPRSLSSLAAAIVPRLYRNRTANAQASGGSRASVIEAPRKVQQPQPDEQQRLQQLPEKVSLAMPEVVQAQPEKTRADEDAAATPLFKIDQIAHVFDLLRSRGRDLDVAMLKSIVQGAVLLLGPALEKDGRTADAAANKRFLVELGRL